MKRLEIATCANQDPLKATTGTTATYATHDFTIYLDLGSNKHLYFK